MAEDLAGFNYTSPAALCAFLMNGTGGNANRLYFRMFDAIADVVNSFTEENPAELGAPLLVGNNLYVGFEPPEPDNCLTIYDTGGDQNAALALDDYTLQFRLRHNEYQIGYLTLQYLISRFIACYSGKAFNQIKIVGIYHEQIPASLGLDDKGRFRFTSNLRMMLSRDHVADRRQAA